MIGLRCVALVVLVAGCTSTDKPAKPHVASDKATFDHVEPAAAPKAPDAVPAKDDGIGDPPKPEPVAVARAPLPAGATISARRDSVLKMLAGGTATAQLPLSATDAGKAFNPSLVDQLTPRAGNAVGVAIVRQKRPTVDGSLDKDIVRRIVRRHVNEVRSCYDDVLRDDQDANGTLTVAIEIAATGKVTSAKSTTKSESLEDMGECVDKAVARWRFPKPPDGKPMTVTYPFGLMPG